MNIKGKLYLKKETQQISQKFAKREFVIETEDKYPQKILLQLTQDKCALLDSYNVGDEIDADINIRGREWTPPHGEVKYFNTLEAWRFNKFNSEKATGITAKFQEDAINDMTSEMQDDIPF